MTGKIDLVDALVGATSIHTLVAMESELPNRCGKGESEDSIANLFGNVRRRLEEVDIVATTKLMKS